MATLEEILENSKIMEEQYKVIEKSTPYAKTHQKIDKLREQKSRLEERIAKLQKRAEKQSHKHYETLDNTPHWWGDTILKPIAEELMLRHENLKSYYIIGSFGLNAETSIWFFETDEGFTGKYHTKNIVGSLTFHSGMLVWNGEMTDTYAKNTIGELNGGNYVMVETKSIEQLDELLVKYMEERKKERNGSNN